MVEGFFETASKVGSLHPRANPERHGVTVERDVAYRERERARDGETERANLLGGTLRAGGGAGGGWTVEAVLPKRSAS